MTLFTLLRGCQVIHPRQKGQSCPCNDHSPLERDMLPVLQLFNIKPLIAANSERKLFKISLNSRQVYILSQIARKQ